MIKELLQKFSSPVLPPKVAPLETAAHALKLIPTALKNLKVPEPQATYVHNYIFNLLMTVLKDDVLIANIQKEKHKTISNLTKL